MRYYLRNRYSRLDLEGLAHAKARIIFDVGYLNGRWNERIFAIRRARRSIPPWKAPEVVEFIGLKKGDKVADIVAGRLTASLAQAVGPIRKSVCD